MKKKASGSQIFTFEFVEVLSGSVRIYSVRLGSAVTRPQRLGASQLNRLKNQPEVEIS